MTDRRRIAAVLLSLGLVTASCGSGDATTTPPTLATTAPAAESAPDRLVAADAADDGAMEDSAVDEGAVDEGAVDEGAVDEGDVADDEVTAEESEEVADETVEPDEPVEPVVNLFPDLDVLNISDGSTVNLASTLGGGTTATLLWFFAPH